MIQSLTDNENGVIKDINEIKAVGHRVVHGGEKFYSASVITPQVIETIKEYIPLAPLHNPQNLAAIEVLGKLMPKATHVAVFDTSFHRNMPEHAYKYALPSKMFEQNYLRRYGFHGTNHQYVSLMAATHIKRPIGELKIISCHLGHGSSLCAIDHGRSIDTSMGLTPLEGLVMGSRSGDIDPGLIIHLAKIGYTPDDLTRLLNYESGIKGISGVSNYIKDVLEAAERGNPRANTAVSIYCYKAKKYIGSYLAVLGQLDVLIFTGGVAENSHEIRARICQGLEAFSIVLDDEANKNVRPYSRQVVEISRPNSKTRILVIPSNEKRMLAIETLHAIGRYRSKEEIQEYRKKPIPINVSAHHVHVNKEAFEKLFGKGRELTPRAELSQPGQYASQETVNLIGPKGKVDRVRILGPFRKECQVEISRTEEFKLGIDAPVRDSGDIEGTPGITLEGEDGKTIKLDKGVICARRHIHMAPEDALGFAIRDKDVIMIRVQSKRELIFGDVMVRVSPSFRLDMHIDTDEANAAEITVGAFGYLEEIQARQFA
ncbi:acetate kinase [Candidatus Magnetoovum chiemensis]|nr:acetate kinase [Candidatus Magnetoovum chiemensis]